MSIILISCSENSTNSINQDNNKLIKPEDFPEVIFPAYNQYSRAKAFLGQKLFTEKLLSKDNSISCASCHKPEHAFAGNTPISKMIGNNVTVRNVPTLVNIAYAKVFNWDGSGKNLEEMIYKDLMLPSVFDNDTNIIVERLNQIPYYKELFNEAFGYPKIEAYKVSYALSIYVRTLISGNSRYDRFRRGDYKALNKSEISGMNLFFSDRTNCSRCHSGLLFTDYQFHNTGTSTHYFDLGRFYVTNSNYDRGKFKTPTLRNIELTSPYKHNGEQITLEEVIDNYNMGGKPFINKDTLIKELNLNNTEKQDLINFLKSLTDEKFNK